MSILLCSEHETIICFIVCFWWSQKHVDELISEILRLYRKFANFTFSMRICVTNALFALTKFWCNWIILLSMSFVLAKMRFRNDFVWWSFHRFFQNITKWFVNFFSELWFCFCFFCASTIFYFFIFSLNFFNQTFFWNLEMNFAFLCLFLSSLSVLWIFLLIFSILS